MNWLSAVGGEFGGSSSYAVSENMTSPIAWFAATIPFSVVATRA